MVHTHVPSQHGLIRVCSKGSKRHADPTNLEADPGSSPYLLQADINAAHLLKPNAGCLAYMMQVKYLPFSGESGFQVAGHVDTLQGREGHTAAISSNFLLVSGGFCWQPATSSFMALFDTLV